MGETKALTPRIRQILTILGMAMVWPSIHNQLLYPITFSFHKENPGSPYAFYILYSVIMLIAVIGILLIERKGLAQKFFSSKAVMVIMGLCGSLGIALLVICDFSSPLAHYFMGIGVTLSSVFVPVYFIFWSIQLAYASKKRVAFDLIASYLVFSLFTLIRLVLQLHAWMFSIAYPLVAAALALVILRAPATQKYASSATPLSGLPWNIIIPAVLLVYLGTTVRWLLNPLSATYDYPPFQRIAVYIVLAVACAVLAALYRPRVKVRRHANLLAFAIVSLFLVASILATSIGLVSVEETGNMPCIAAVNLIELFVWLIALTTIQSKHAGVIKPAAAFLVGVVGAAHLSSVLILSSIDHAHLSFSEIPMVVVTIGLAFIEVIVVMVVMTLLLYRSKDKGDTSAALSALSGVAQGTTAQNTTDAAAPSGNLGAQPVTLPCLTIATDEIAMEQIQSTFGLSKRETDTLRLAARNKSVKEIASSLYVAESTVNSHIKGIYRKCDVHSRQELIALVNRFKREVK